jgi:hypothetical protein
MVLSSLTVVPAAGQSESKMFANQRNTTQRVVAHVSQSTNQKDAMSLFLLAIRRKPNEVNEGGSCRVRETEARGHILLVEKTA